MKITQQSFDKGLSLEAPIDAMAEGYTRRNRGIHPLSLGSFRSRNGSKYLISRDAHSIAYFANKYFYGVGKSLYGKEALIKTNLSGARLRFSRMPPVAGIVDYLFCCGGGALFKIDSDGNVTNWGIPAPISAPTAAADNTAYTSIRTAAYKWTRSGVRDDLVSGYSWIASAFGTNEYYLAGGISVPNALEIDSVVALTGAAGSLTAGEWDYTDNDSLGFNTIYIRLVDGSDPDTGNYDLQALTFNGNEYYCELAAGGDPSLPSPTFVRENNLQLTAGSIGALTASQYTYGDNDSLGFSTIYVRLADSSDPDTKALNYVDYTDDTVLLSGTYKYQITYYNSATGHRGNGNGDDISVTVDEQYIKLTSIPNPASIDSQITHVEIWRSEADADALFYLTSVTAGTTTFTDDATITLSSEELPTDNLEPFSTFNDCLGPHNASIFWLSSDPTARGYIYYSPIGRAESNQGYINVCGNDTPLQRLFRFQGQLGVIGESGIWLIGGSNPYIAREASGCPGTTQPDSVVVVPEFGVYYEAADGIRCFNGTTSTLVSQGSIERIFRGESAGDLSVINPSFSRIACYARNEYIFSDSIQTISYDIIRNRWRDLGLACKALFYNPETDELSANIDGSILALENETQLIDNRSAIPISLNPPHHTFEDTLQHFFAFTSIDCATSHETITPIVSVDGIETTLPTFETDSRSKATLFPSAFGNSFGMRFTASLKDRIEIFRITHTFLDMISFQDSQKHLLQYLLIDLRTDKEISFELLVDGELYSITTLQPSTRKSYTIPIGLAGFEFLAYPYSSIPCYNFDLYEIGYLFSDRNIKVNP